ncbi:MAG: protein kinase [Syntrophobacteraceae bacterium]|jgi:serine/threonine protein kinase
MIGKTIKNRYEIVAKIGEGGMGVVYKALDKTLHRPVAIKMLHPAQSSLMLKTRFQVEALVTASLNHRSIVTLYDFSEEEENQFLVMELLEGKTGKQLLEEKGAIPFPELIKIFGRVIEGLVFAHNHGIIHRDIKPNNIMITTSGEVKLMDFGIARAKDSPQMTQTGFTVGSALYMSPEQIRNQKLDYRSDIYSLGITMFEMATGTAPFQDPNASDISILIGHLSSELPSPRSVNPDLPESLEEVILKATRKNPDDRFQTMEEFGLALTSNAESTKFQPILKDAPPTGKASPTDRKQYKSAEPPRHSVFSHMGPGAIFLAVILVVGLAAIVTLLVRWGGERDETKRLAERHEVPIEKGTDTPRAIEPKQVELPPKPAPVRIAFVKTMRMKEGKIPLEVKESDILTQNDRYYIVFSPDEELYIYAAQVNYSAESIDPIFPNRQFSSNNNPMMPHLEYRFPEKGYFFLDERAGGEYIYVVASRSPNQRLENIYQALTYTGTSRIKQLTNEFVEVLNQQDPANVRTIWFWHE